jgi:hypothetical protein
VIREVVFIRDSLEERVSAYGLVDDGSGRIIWIKAVGPSEIVPNLNLAGPDGKVLALSHVAT